MKLLKFGAKWCGPCQAMKPVLKKFLAAHPVEDFVEYDLDKKEDFEVAERMHVKAIPTLIWVSGKPERVLQRVEGAAPLQELEDAHARATAKVTKVTKRAKKVKP